MTTLLTTLGLDQHPGWAGVLLFAIGALATALLALWSQARLARNYERRFLYREAKWIQSLRRVEDERKET